MSIVAFSGEELFPGLTDDRASNFRCVKWVLSFDKATDEHHFGPGMEHDVRPVGERRGYGYVTYNRMEDCHGQQDDG
jgi:hypothetical protein